MSTPLHLRLVPEPPFQKPIYPRRHLTMMCMLLNVQSSEWYSEFESVYRKCPGIERMADEFIELLGEATAYYPFDATEALRDRPDYVFDKHFNFAVPALLRRDCIQMRRNEPVASSAVYESIALKPKSLEEADLIHLDDGSTISVKDELVHYDLFDSARHRWGWLGATAAKAYIAMRRNFTPRHTLPSSDDDDAPLSQSPVQSVASAHEPAHDSSDLRRRHRSPCS
ncbi:hypothetical protein OF846_003772 [Rhodotorula toruloides]|nr:hypothetical protein OF846_003772 [Rhodotorula toruloides]